VFVVFKEAVEFVAINSYRSVLPTAPALASEISKNEYSVAQWESTIQIFGY